MSRFESSIKQIPYSQTAVYNKISNLENLEEVRDRVSEDKVKDFHFDHDSVSISVAPVGDLRLRIINREEPKCVKFESEQSPIPFNLWIQLLPVTETSCKMKITVEASLNPFIKGMVSGPLQEGIEKIADTLAAIPYE